MWFVIFRLYRHSIFLQVRKEWWGANSRNKAFFTTYDYTVDFKNSEIFITFKYSDVEHL